MRNGRSTVTGVRLVLAATALIGPGLIGEADEVEFAAGGRVSLPARYEGDEVILDAPSGMYRFLRRDFRSVVVCPTPPEQWPERRRSALQGDSGQRLAAGWWALEHGLTPEAEAMLRASHDADPSRQPTARMVAMLDRLDRPAAEPDIARFHRLMGGRGEVARGRHVVLIHQLDPAEAAERIEVMDRVARTFYLIFAAQGLELEPPERLPIALGFARRRDYREFLSSEGAGAFVATRGYFHPTAGYVALYDSRSDPTLQQALAEIASRRDRARRGKSSDAVRRDTDRRSLLLDLDRRALDLGTAAHEMVHQLTASSGLAPRYDRFPVWLHEGLAMQFEVVHGGRWAGIGRLNDIRLEGWHSSGRRSSLAALLRDEGLGEGYDQGRYSEAWALVYYLRKEHPRTFSALIDRLRVADPTAGDRPPDLWPAPLGPDPSAIEAPWLRYIACLGREGPAPEPGMVDDR